MLVETMPKGSEARNKRLVSAVYQMMVELAPASRKGGLPVNQQRIHELIFQFVQERGYPPTYREMGKLLGMAHMNVFRCVMSMKKRGVLEILHGSTRGIVLKLLPGQPLPKIKPTRLWSEVPPHERKKIHDARKLDRPDRLE